LKINTGVVPLWGIAGLPCPEGEEFSLVIPNASKDSQNSHCARLPELQLFFTDEHGTPNFK